MLLEPTKKESWHENKTVAEKHQERKLACKTCRNLPRMKNRVKIKKLLKPTKNEKVT